MTKNEFLVLLERFHQRQLTAVEIDALLDAAKEFEYENLLTDKLQQELLEFNADADVGEEKEEKVWSKVQAHIQEKEAASIQYQNKVKRMYPMRKWIWTAASVIALLGVGAYFLYTKKDPGTAMVKSKLKNDVPAGKNGAILTLADGKEVSLDSLPDGLIAMQEGTATRVENGKLLYEGTGNDSIVYNTMSTPRGRQFQLTLPDGSQVWLNAASSIRYPTTFNGKERKVSVTGEVYFDVAKNAAKPFIVDVDGKMDVQVLGTHFNVNAYADEPYISTTLVEGSIRLAGQSDFATSLTGKILKPGQQALTTSSKTIIYDDTDLQMVTAWKEGAFQFNYTPVKDILRQFARWYDVEVIYELKAPAFVLTGTIKRYFSLSEALSTLELMGLHYKIEDKKLIILP